MPGVEIKEVETLDDGRIATYYEDYSMTAKTYKTMGGPSDLFKEFSVLFLMVAILHMNPYAMPKGKVSLLIVEFTSHMIDWAEWMAESILREIAANRKKPVPALAH